MTNISTGNLATSGTKTFIVGTSSGLDTAALIEVAVQQKTLKADLIDIQIDENSAKVGAFSELQSLSLNLQTALESLKSPTNFLEDNANSFIQKTGFVTTSDGSDSGNILSIAIDSDAVKGSYDIEVLQTAEAQKVIGTSVADADADLGYAGSFTLGLTGGATDTISITADQSLQEVADAINAVSDTTNVVASVLKVSETDFQLVLTGSETAVDIEVTGVTGDDVLNLVGVTDGLGGFQNELQAAQGAIIELDGVTITRDDNVFDDLIDGIELNLNNASPGTIVTLEVDSDAQAVKDSILEFIEAYNALREFILANQEVSEAGEVSDDALLFSEPLLELLSQEITTILGSDFSDNSTNATIRDLGLSFTDNNFLEISDETALDTAILNNPEEVQSFFSTSFTSDNTEFALLQNKSSQGTQSITFDITVDGGGTITAVTANGDAAAFTISGSLLIGAAGTVYEGLSFTYQGTTSATINTTINQGLADQLYNRIDEYANSVDGLFQEEKLALEETNQDLSEEANRIRELAEEFRSRQIEKYAELEARIEQLKLLQNQIRAILGINEDDN